MAKPQDFKKDDPRINREGRPPRDWTVAGLIEEAMEEQDETGVPAKKIIYKKLVTLAKKGDMLAVKEINQRLDGMPKQSTDITSGGKELQYNQFTDEQLNRVIEAKAKQVGATESFGGEGKTD